MKELACVGEVFLFTASTKPYADPIIDEIDPLGVIKHRFYRDVSKYSVGVVIKLTLSFKTVNLIIFRVASWIRMETWSSLWTSSLKI